MKQIFRKKGLNIIPYSPGFFDALLNSDELVTEIVEKSVTV